MATVKTAMSFRQKNFLILAAATISSRSHGWVSRPLLLHSSHLVVGQGFSVESKRTGSSWVHHFDTQPDASRTGKSEAITSLRARRRNYSSRGGGGKSKGILSRVGSAVKSALPNKWFRSEEEKQKLQRQKEVRDGISGSLNEVLKDAPLGMRMMGRMVGPLMGRVASGFAETMAEQQRATEALLEQAQASLQ